MEVSGTRHLGLSSPLARHSGSPASPNDSNMPTWIPFSFPRKSINPAGPGRAGVKPLRRPSSPSFQTPATVQEPRPTALVSGSVPLAGFRERHLACRSKEKNEFRRRLRESGCRDKRSGVTPGKSVALTCNSFVEHWRKDRKLLFRRVFLCLTPHSFPPLLFP